MSENEISKVAVDCCFQVHKELGPGLFESVYEECLFYLFRKNEVKVERQKEIPVHFRDVKMEIGFRADMVIENKLILEIKSIEKVLPVHQKQLLTYLRLTGMKLGLLVNFNEVLIKNGIQRIVNNL